MPLEQDAADRPATDGLLVRPDPGDPRLTRRVTGVDQAGAPVETSVTVERAITLYLNSQEIVTMMTIGDYPEDLALGYLLNQNMLKPDDIVTDVEWHEDLDVVVVRTEHGTNFEDKLKKKTLTSGCAQGTAFGDLMEALDDIELFEEDLEAELQAEYKEAPTRKRRATATARYLAAAAGKAESAAGAALSMSEAIVQAAIANGRAGLSRG